MADLEVANLRKDFPGRTNAVGGVSFTVRGRELLAVVGPSGCGKTTLLRLVAGLDEPTAGTIRLGGRDLARVPPGERNVAMVFQSYALYPQKTVYENLAFPLRARRADPDGPVRAIAATLGLLDHLDRLPSQLSGGQQQRVALGRALVRQPDVFLFDEPLSNLDAHLRRETRWELKRLQREAGTAAVYVTHDHEEAMSLADRLAVMCDGRILQVGPPDEVYHDPATRTVAALVGSPPMNLLDGVLTHDAEGLTLSGPGVRLPAAVAARLTAHAGRQLTLGFRPESPRTSAAGSDALRLRGRVLVCEHLGPHTDVVLTAEGGARLVARRPSGGASPSEGAPIELFVSAASCYWFAASGERLR